MNRLSFLRSGHTPRRLLAAGLVIIWLVVLIGLVVLLPIQIASWLTFIALLIAPGYFLADIITWRLGLDWLEHLALSLPLGVAALAVPGGLALLQHLTIIELVAGWGLMVGLILVAWLLHGRLVRWRPHLVDGVWVQQRAQSPPWRRDEIILLLVLAVAFIAILPTLSLHKIDGDAYAVNAFTADALAGLPLNQAEPLFGTDLGPGVRMIFNQTLPMAYLWSYLADIDPITLTASASRSMIALWALLASYTLGKAAGGSRRFGLLTAAVQMIIYLAAPFLRGDNVSLFFFERINADKFMVPVTMLPVVFAFAIRYVRDGRRQDWLAAAAATVAVSAIHPLVAAMLALAVGAFAGLHLLLNLRDGRGPVVSANGRRRALALGGLVAIVMFLPIVQLVISRGQAPLAASYPDSFDGWPMGERLVPALPFVHVPTLDLYGPLPDLARLEAADANSATNPFLIWRFSVNMNRRRILLFDIDRYLSDPSLILEPPYLLALLLLPLLLPRLRRDVAAQFAVATALGVLFVMFNPLLTPLIGSLVMPWILWRLVWVLPYALIIALAAERLYGWGTALWRRRRERPFPLRPAAFPLAFVLLAGLLLAPAIRQNMRTLQERAAAPYFYPTPDGIFARLNALTASGTAAVLADQDLSVTLPAYVANAAVIAHRAPTTSEVFPADQQDDALQRLIDQDQFFRTPFLTADSVAILHRYDVAYIIAASGSDLDLQLRLAPGWFQWLLDDQSYSLYAVRQMPDGDTALSIRGNSALIERQWGVAEQRYQRALEQDSDDLLALLGMAEIAHAQGQFEVAQTWLNRATALSDLPNLHYRMGQLYAERGEVEASVTAFERAQRLAPHVARFHVALGDACLTVGQEACTAAQYRAAAAKQTLPDEPARLIAQGDLWRQRNRIDQAIPLYETAIAERPSQVNQFILERAYREAGDFEQAHALVSAMQSKQPFSSEVLTVAASLNAEQGEVDTAVAQYRRAILLQEFQAQESAQTRLSLAGILLADGRLDAAEVEIERALALQPYNAAAHRLRGDLFDQQQDYAAAVDAYQRSFELDPNRIETYVALSNALRQHGGRPEEVLELLQAAIALNPREATLYLALGDQLQQVGNELAAIDVYESALDMLSTYSLAPGAGLRPRDADRGLAYAYARLGGAYETLADWGPAINYYRAAVVASPNAAWTQVILGDALRRFGDLQEATIRYERALQNDPTNVDAYLGLAELAIEQVDYEKAEARLEEALAINPDDVNIFIRLGELAQRQTDPAQALAWFDQAAALPLTGETVNVNLIDALVDYGDVAGALDYVTEAVAYRPGDVELLLRLGQIQRRLGRYDEAETTLLAARRLDRRNGRLHAELAALADARGEPRAALVFYQQAIDLQPDDATNYLAAAQIWTGQGHLEQALAVLQAGRSQVARPSDLTVAMAGLQRRQGRPEAARQTLEAALAQEENAASVDLRLALADHLVSRAEFDDAEAEIERALALEPDNAAVHLALADFHLRQNETAAALRAARRAIDLAPDNPGPYLTLARIYDQTGRTDDAIAAAAQAVAVAPTVENSYTNLAALYQAEERPLEAQAALERGLAVAPTSSVLLSAYADVLVGQEAPDEALAALNGAIEAGPRTDLLVARAEVYHRLGRLDDARRDLQTALQQSPGDLDALLTLGDLHREQDAFALAQEQYEAVVGFQPGVPVGYLRLGALANEQGNREQAESYVEAARSAEPGALIRPEDDAS